MEKHSETCNKADIGVIGLAVMGQNLILNMDEKGYVVAAYNRTVEKVTQFMNTRAKGTKIRGATSLKEFVKSLKRPRKIMLMVKADAVDHCIKEMLPLLDYDDIIIDGGNSNHEKTEERVKDLRSIHKICFIGCGVSGGEEGARHGPSLMPGGNEVAWQYIKDIFRNIAAKSDNEPCCDWVGEGGAGHFVKTVHNGIEYGDMQLICEAYHIMKSLGMTQEQMATFFDKWNGEELESYLIEITRDILRYKDGEGYLLDRIVDSAGQKGTGKWVIISALNIGVPVTLIGEAVFSRFLSSLKDERLYSSTILKGPETKPKVDNLSEFMNSLKYALYCAKIVSYAQGFMLMSKAAKENNWKLNYGQIAHMWRGGCIIRSTFLRNIKEAYDRSGNAPENLLHDKFFADAIHHGQHHWRKVVSQAFLWGIPVPALSAGLAFYDGYRTEQLPANLLQAQRDYFGAHTYKLVGKEGDHHTNWTGRGGDVSATTYQA